MPKRTCAFCGEIIPRGGTRGRFCTKRCYGDWKLSLRPIKPCKTCGQLFSFPPSRNQNKGYRINLYCSRRCAARTEREEWAGQLQDIKEAWIKLDGTTQGWIAGMLDGEGCICNNGKARPSSVRVDIANTDLPAMRFLQSLLPHSLLHIRKGQKPGWKPLARWGYYGVRAAQLCRLIAPLLHIKGQKAQALADKFLS